MAERPSLNVVPAPINPLAGLTEGRIVHFVMANGKHRPAIVVETWNNAYHGSVNLQVFTDGGNDGGESLADHNRNIAGTRWETSVHFDPDGGPRTWHWPERA